MLKNTLCFLFLLLISLQAFGAQKLANFETDYCTMFEEGTPSKPDAWKQCCYEHDLRFWFGGSGSQRDLADLRLKSCVEKTGHSYIAKAMYYAVRAGKYSPVKHKYKWGWGWTPYKEYESLTSDQKKVVRKKLGKLNIDPKMLKEFLNFYNL